MKKAVFSIFCIFVLCLNFSCKDPEIIIPPPPPVVKPDTVIIKTVATFYFKDGSYIVYTNLVNIWDITLGVTSPVFTEDGKDGYGHWMDGFWYMLITAQNITEATAVFIGPIATKLIGTNVSVGWGDISGRYNGDPVNWAPSVYYFTVKKGENIVPLQIKCTTY